MTSALSDLDVCLQMYAVVPHEAVAHAKILLPETAGMTLAEVQSWLEAKRDAYRAWLEGAVA